jgi:hypothetical protein
MQPDTFRTLAQYIYELKRRDRHYHPTGEHPAFDTTTEDDAHWDQRDRSGDVGRGQDTQG